MTVFDYLWIGWGLYFVIVEGYALYLNTVEKKAESKTRRTLSSLVWFIGGTTEGYRADVWGWLRRGALGLFLLWIVVHFLSGGQIV